MTFSNLAPLEVAKCKRIDDVRDGERGEGRVGEWKRKEAGGGRKAITPMTVPSVMAPVVDHPEEVGLRVV